MEPETLENLRKKSEKSMGTILAELRQIAPAICPSQRSGIIHWEKQGITDVRVIRALSTVYGVDFEVIERAALHAKDRFKKKDRSELLINAT